jgi:hypothetical protein
MGRQFPEALMAHGVTLPATSQAVPWKWFFGWRLDELKTSSDHSMSSVGFTEQTIKKAPSSIPTQGCSTLSTL